MVAVPYPGDHDRQLGVRKLTQANTLNLSTAQKVHPAGSVC
jgi:hypothetical protein